jgi:hypothetical protein
MDIKLARCAGCKCVLSPANPDHDEYRIRELGRRTVLACSTACARVGVEPPATLKQNADTDQRARLDAIAALREPEEYKEFARAFHYLLTMIEQFATHPGVYGEPLVPSEHAIAAVGAMADQMEEITTRLSALRLARTGAPIAIKSVGEWMTKLYNQTREAFWLLVRPPADVDNILIVERLVKEARDTVSTMRSTLETVLRAPTTWNLRYDARSLFSVLPRDIVAKTVEYTTAAASPKRDFDPPAGVEIHVVDRFNLPPEGTRRGWGIDHLDRHIVCAEDKLYVYPDAQFEQGFTVELPFSPAHFCVDFTGRFLWFLYYSGVAPAFHSYLVRATLDAGGRVFTAHQWESHVTGAAVSAMCVDGAGDVWALNTGAKNLLHLRMHENQTRLAYNDVTLLQLYTTDGGSTELVSTFMTPLDAGVLCVTKPQQRLQFDPTTFRVLPPTAPSGRDTYTVWRTDDRYFHPPYALPTPAPTAVCASRYSERAYMLSYTPPNKDTITEFFIRKEMASRQWIAKNNPLSVGPVFSSNERRHHGAVLDLDSRGRLFVYDRTHSWVSEYVAVPAGTPLGEQQPQQNVAFGAPRGAHFVVTEMPSATPEAIAEAKRQRDAEISLALSRFRTPSAADAAK